MWPLVVISVLQPGVQDLEALARASLRPRICVTSGRSRASRQSIWSPADSVARATSPCLRLADATAELKTDPKAALKMFLALAADQPELVHARWLGIVAAGKLDDIKTAKTLLASLKDVPPPPSPTIQYAVARLLAQTGAAQSATAAYTRALPLASFAPSTRERVDLRLEAALGIATTDFAKGVDSGTTPPDRLAPPIASARSIGLARAIFARSPKNRRPSTGPVLVLVLRLAGRDAEAAKVLNALKTTSWSPSSIQRYAVVADQERALLALGLEKSRPLEASRQWLELARTTKNAGLAAVANRSAARLAPPQKRRGR